MDEPKATDYREWDEQADSSWFRWGRRPAKIILAEVRSLTAEYASRLWRWVFPTDKDVLPLVAKDKKGWLKDVFDSEPILYSGPDTPPLEKHLRRLFSWPDDDRVFFLVRCGTGYETPWGVYVMHGESFFGWYDEGLLFHPTAREVAVFWENYGFFGRRSKRRFSLRNTSG